MAPAIGFWVRFVLIIPGIQHRQLISFAVTANPTAEWTARRSSRTPCRRSSPSTKRFIANAEAVSSTYWLSLRFHTASTKPDM